ncbi:RT0821/Lpp0805 family surface protein [Azospirillum sp. SYSU D00513]|uniref:RT0821/Lpp0805 family surface protein n=1 Tax=Azospirillum sp. SYSU D00513 TaxID=2812561 RepID=UPI0032B52906
MPVIQGGYGGTGGYANQGGGGVAGMSGSETLGTLGGAGVGAVIGSQIGGGTGKLVAVGVGTLLGAFAGREIARRLDPADERQAAVAERNAIAQNQTIRWDNPQSGYTGTVEPVRSYQNANGQLCRDYTHTIVVDGRYETARGTACQGNDGNWRLMS